MYSRNFLVTALVLFFTQSYAQNNFRKTYGGGLDDEVRHMNLTSDGSLLVAGSTQSFGSGGADGYLLRLDDNGSVLWSKAFGDNLDNYIEWVEETNDKGLILCGYTFSVTSQKFLINVIRTDSNGVILWQKNAGLSSVARAYCIRETFDYGFILCGEEDSTSVDGNLLLIKMDSIGNVVWSRSYGRAIHADVGKCVIQTRDSGFAVCATSRDGVYSNHIFLLKTDRFGNLSLSRNYYHINQYNSKTNPNRIYETDDGGYVIAGSSYLTGQPELNIFMTLTDSSFNPVWSNVYSSGNWDAVHDFIDLGESNGYILAGYTSSPLSGTENALVLRTDVNGTLLWNEKYDNDSLSSRFSRALLKDENSYYFAGNTVSYGAGGQDMMVARRDSSRFSNDCLSSPVLMTSIPFPLSDSGPASGFSLSISTTNTVFNQASGGIAKDVCMPLNTHSVAAEAPMLYCYDLSGRECWLENKDKTYIISSQLFDIGSKLVWEESVRSNAEKVRIEIPELSKGIYFLVIRTTAGSLQRKLLVNR